MTMIAAHWVPLPKCQSNVARRKSGGSPNPPLAMHFSFAAKKGFIATTISGIIRVNNDSLVIDSDLPGLVTTFIS